MPRKGKRKTLNEVPNAGPVTVRYADGTSTTLPPYNRRQAHNVIEAGRKAPRTWSEANSTAGGGHDRRRL